MPVITLDQSAFPAFVAEALDQGRHDVVVHFLSHFVKVTPSPAEVAMAKWHRCNPSCRFIRMGEVHVCTSSLRCHLCDESCDGAISGRCPTTGVAVPPHGYGGASRKRHRPSTVSTPLGIPGLSLTQALTPTSLTSAAAAAAAAEVSTGRIAGGTPCPPGILGALESFSLLIRRSELKERSMVDLAARFRIIQSVAPGIAGAYDAEVPSAASTHGPFDVLFGSMSVASAAHRQAYRAEMAASSHLRALACPRGECAADAAVAMGGASKGRGRGRWGARPGAEGGGGGDADVSAASGAAPGPRPKPQRVRKKVVRPPGGAHPHSDMASSPLGRYASDGHGHGHDEDDHSHPASASAAAKSLPLRSTAEISMIVSALNTCYAYVFSRMRILTLFRIHRNARRVAAEEINKMVKAAKKSGVPFSMHSVERAYASSVRSDTLEWTDINVPFMVRIAALCVDFWRVVMHGATLKSYSVYVLAIIDHLSSCQPGAGAAWLPPRLVPMMGDMSHFGIVSKAFTKISKSIKSSCEMRGCSAMEGWEARCAPLIEFLTRSIRSHGPTIQMRIRAEEARYIEALLSESEGSIALDPSTLRPECFETRDDMVFSYPPAR